MGAYENLLDQIDRFIRKYYKNEMVKGLLFFIGSFLITFLLTTTLEYFGRFNSVVRAMLFFSFITINVYIFSYYFFRSLLKLFSFGKQINRYQAAKIIGDFFPNISDRLLNTLQLSDELQYQNASLELISASVSQRASSLSVFSFSNAINIKENNKKYILYIVPIFSIILLIAFFLPNFFTQSTERVVYFKQEFKPEAPFSFHLKSSKFIVEEGEDLKVDLNLSGSSLPEKVYITSSLGTFLMDKNAKNGFSFLLKNIRTSTSFHFTANDFESSFYAIQVVGKSVLKKLTGNISFPSYLNMEPQKIENIGDLILPEGSVINWDVLSDNTSFVDVEIYQKKKHFTTPGFNFKTQFLNSTPVTFLLKNRHTEKLDSTSFNVSIIKDAYPSISVEELKDSLKSSLCFFSVFASDDYGVTDLSFVYTVTSAGKTKKNVLPIKSNKGTSLSHIFSFDFLRADLKLNDHVEYYLMVKDNDALHGGKVTKSIVYTYEAPSLEELVDKRDDVLNNSQATLSSMLNRSEQFMKNVDLLKKDVLNNKSSDYNKLQQIKQLKEEQKSLENLLENIQNELNQSGDELNQLSEVDQELLEKQELIDDLLNQVMDDELLDLLNQLEDLFKDNGTKEEINEKIDDLEMNSEDLNKQLDRSIEMLKKLQVNEKVDAIEKQLDELAKDQNDLKNEMLNKSISKEDEIKKQDEIDKRFEEIKDDLDALDKLNNDLSKPIDFGNTDELENKISDDLKEASDKVKKSNSSKASQNQTKASDNMKKLSKQLDDKQSVANKQQQEEDIASLRMILKNLVKVSFDQEKVMNDFIVSFSNNSTSYSIYSSNQQKIINNTGVIRDSLNALAKRQPKIATFIDNELNTIFKNFNYVTNDIDEHNKRPLAIHQQTVMTSFNNLALLLNESLESMQSQMNSDKPGGGSCDTPGGKGKPKPGDGEAGDMKEMLKKQLEQLKKGSSPGGKSEGSSPSLGGLTPKQISKMASQQAMIRKKLESLKTELNKDGKGTGNQLNDLINELEQQEKDLINKKFSPKMIQRQQSILTRLLESEKALIEKGFDEKRESKTGKVYENGNQIRFEEYKKEKLKEIEFFRSIDPLYQKYYKDKANEYFNRGI